MKAGIKQLSLATTCLAAMLLHPAVYAAFLNAGDAESAQIDQLMTEAAVIGTVSQGILLSVTQCESDEVCLNHVNRHEVQQMIDTINERVDSLTLRRETTGEKGLEDVLIAYVEQRENLSNYLDRINLIVPDDDIDDELGGDDFFGITTTPSITEQYSIFNDFDESLEDEEFIPAGEEEAVEIPPVIDRPLEEGEAGTP